MSERTNTAATNSRDAGVLQGPQAPNAPTACNFVRILPVRFALSSEEAPPVGEAGLPAYMRAVEEKKNLKYTLRLLRNGFVHVYHATDDKFSWQVKDGTIEQIGMCPYSSAEDKSSYIRLPEDWGKAYIAFSNAPPEDFWPQYLGNGELVLSRFHEVTWEKGAKGISSPSTLCGAPEKLAEWVEEFRKEPGFVRALFEYEDTTVLEYFDPELGHFKPTTFPEAITKRWRRTKSWNKQLENLPSDFTWLQLRNKEGIIPSDNILQKLGEHELSGLMALADPAGICMECAALHHYSMRAWNDFTTWYTQAVTLGNYIRELDSSLPVLQKQATVFSPDYLAYYKETLQHPSWGGDGQALAWALLSTGKNIGDALREQLVKGSQSLDTHLDALLDFWLAWLDGTFPYSLAYAARDYDTAARRGSDGWETLFSLCTFELTFHEHGAAKTRPYFEKPSQLSYLVWDRLEKSLWAKEEDIPNDEYLAYAQIIVNFGGLLPTRLDVARGMNTMPSYGEQLTEALSEMLSKKMGPMLEPSPCTDHEAVALFLLTSYEGERRPAPPHVTDAVPFDISTGLDTVLKKYPTTGAAFDDLFEVGNLLKSAELLHALASKLPAGARQISRLYAAFSQWKGLPTESSGAFPSGTELKFSTGVMSVMEYAGRCVTVISLMVALGEQATDEKRGGWGWIDVASNALSTLEMACMAKQTVFSRQYGKFAAPYVEAWLLKNNLGREVICGIGGKIGVQTLSRIAGALGAVYSGYEAWREFQKGQTAVGIGHVCLGVGSVFLLANFHWVGLILSISGLIVVVAGKVDRLQYRIANSYLGENNRMVPAMLARQANDTTLKQEFLNSTRHEIEVADGFDPASYKAVVPFSYQKKCVPDNAMDRDDKEKSPIYTYRTRQLSLDLKLFELLTYKIILEPIYDKEKNLMHVHIVVPFATAASTLKIKSVQYVLFENTADYLEVLQEIPVDDLYMACSLKYGLPCWYFGFAAPENPFQKFIFSATKYVGQPGKMTIWRIGLRVTMDFDYGSPTDAEARELQNKALKILELEDKAFRGMDDDFYLKKTEEYTTLTNFSVINDVVPFLPRFQQALPTE